MKLAPSLADLAGKDELPRWFVILLFKLARRDPPDHDGCKWNVIPAQISATDCALQPLVVARKSKLLAWGSH